MIKYMIDYTEGSGSGCDKLFDTREDAQVHMDTSWTPKEREGCVIVEVEVGYLVAMQVGGNPSRYVWCTEDVDNGGSVDCPNGWNDTYPTRDEAEAVKDELENYAEGNGFSNTSFFIEEVVL